MDDSEKLNLQGRFFHYRLFYPYNLDRSLKRFLPRKLKSCLFQNGGPSEYNYWLVITE